MIRKSPGFAAAAILTLALGIGATSAVFSFVDAVLLKPLPFPEPEKIINVWEKPPDSQRNVISSLNFLDWKSQNTVFSAMAAQTWSNLTLTGADVPVELKDARVSAGFFKIFGINPMLGRTFAPDEDQLGKEHEVVLSHRIWESRFGADAKIVGQDVRLSGEPYRVVGVMPAGVFDRQYEDLWSPLAFTPQERTRNYHWMICWARLKPGVTLEQAREQMNGIGARIAHDYPESNKGWGVTVDRYQDRFVGPDLRRSLLVLLAAVGAVLLIGCVNLANLLLVRGAGREREVAIRSALGAGRTRLVRQFLTESVLLAGFGGLFGVGLGWGLMMALKRWTPEFYLPSEADVQMNVQVLVFAAVMAIATGILFGIAPALRSARADLVNSLKEGGRGASSGVSRAHVRNALAVSEIALAFVLLSGAGLLLRSFSRLQQVDPGFHATNVITMRLHMRPEEYPDGTHIVNYFDQVMEKIHSVPGVLDVAVTGAVPFQGWPDGMGFQIAGRPVVDIANRPDCGFKPVSPSYLSALGLQLLKGRWLAESDTAGAPPVAVINQTMATKYFKNQDPIGQRILIKQIIPGQPALGPEIAWEVVGVIVDEKTNRLDDSGAGLYVSYKQSPGVGTSLVVRGAMEPTHLVKSIETAVWQVNKNQAFDRIRTLDELKAESLGDNRMRTTLLGTFAALALVLAAIGVYGVISYSVTQRTHELGVRSALGASQAAQLALVMKSGMALAFAGLGIGIAGALVLTRVLRSFLFQIGPRDPSTLLIVGTVMTAVVAAACLIPAHRATRVDPLVALRHE
jgi:putative ABC transport system permease protein